jgi:hypothetical protein
MMPHQEDIARYLVAQGLGVLGGDADWGIHVNVEPAAPHRVITVYATDGLGSDGPDTDELDILRVAFQVRTRSGRLGETGNVYSEAFAKQEAIRDKLILPNGPLVTANSTFHFISMTSDIVPIGRDENDRHLIVANYRANRERA